MSTIANSVLGRKVLASSGRHGPHPWFDDLNIREATIVAVWVEEGEIKVQAEANGQSRAFWLSQLHLTLPRPSEGEVDYTR